MGRVTRRPFGVVSGVAISNRKFHEVILAKGSWIAPLLNSDGCEELIRVPKSLELQCIASWVLDKHGGLFANLAFKAHAGGNEKKNVESAQMLGKPTPLIPVENNPEVWDWYVITIDWIGRSLFGRLHFYEMRDDLVTE